MLCMPVQATLLPPRPPLQLLATGATCLKRLPTQKATMVVRTGATMTVGTCHTCLLCIGVTSAAYPDSQHSVTDVC